MLNLSDKDIDRLSRDAAEFYEPDHSLLSWKKLEQNLVEQIPERPPDSGSIFRIRPVVWAPAILLLTGLTYFIIKNAAHNKIYTLKPQTERSRPDRSASTLKNDIKKNNPLTNTPTEEASGKPGSSGTPAEIAAPVASAARRTRLNVSSGKNIFLHDSQADHAGLSPGMAGTSRGDAGTGIPGTQPHSSGTDLAGSIASGNSAKTAGRQKAYNVQLPEPVTSFGHPFVTGNDSSLNRFAGFNHRPQKPPRSLKTNRSLTVGLVTGPDYTDVGGMPNDELGSNLGISIGYYLSSRLSINTGFQFTVKNYWADGRLFQPQPGNGMNTAAYAFPRIESVNGRSNMYEIPLTLRYDFLQHEKTRLFVGAGLSSYLMRKEQYTFFFHNAGRPYEWDNKNDQHRNYWFAVGNFSAGLEQDLGKGFSFQTEPFVRTPFRGMGTGNIKMNSFGILFSLRYAPVLGRTRK